MLWVHIKQNRYSQLLTSRYFLPLGILKTISTVNLLISISITATTEYWKEQLFFSHVHNSLNLQPVLAEESISDLAKWQFPWWCHPNDFKKWFFTTLMILKIFSTLANPYHKHTPNKKRCPLSSSNFSNTTAHPRPGWVAFNRRN